MATSKEASADLIRIMEELTPLLEKWTEKGTKLAARQARKLTMEFQKTAKVFRTQSVSESK